MSNAPHYLQIDKVVLLGRTFDEYRRMFALDQQTLEREVILDAASGVSSFCAEGNALGYNITASDAIYSISPDEIEAKCAEDLRQVMAKLPPIADLYIWEEFADVKALTRQRERAYQAFLPDYRRYGASRYVPTVYPESSFATDAFTLTLVSHLLFLYEDQLDHAFHRTTLRELLRITSDEVRIYPITNLRGKRSIYVDQLMADALFEDYDFVVVPVDYEFLKNATEMLCVRHANDAQETEWLSNE
jgi:hypothetical protein